MPPLVNFYFHGNIKILPTRYEWWLKEVVGRTALYCWHNHTVVRAISGRHEAVASLIAGSFVVVNTAAGRLAQDGIGRSRQQASILVL